MTRRQAPELRRVLDVPPCGPDCRVCHPDSTRPGKVSADRLWRWSLRNPGKRPFR